MGLSTKSLTIFWFAVATCVSASSIKGKPDTSEFCYDEGTNTTIPYDKEVAVPGECAEFICTKFDNKTLYHWKHECTKVKIVQRSGHYLTEGDPSQTFPKCCPQLFWNSSFDEPIPEPVPVKVNPDECYDFLNKRMIRVNETVDVINECIRYQCHKVGDTAILLEAMCPSVKPGKGEVLVEDPSKRYPDCCPAPQKINEFCYDEGTKITIPYDKEVAVPGECAEFVCTKSDGNNTLTHWKRECQTIQLSAKSGYRVTVDLTQKFPGCCQQLIPIEKPKPFKGAKL